MSEKLFNAFPSSYNTEHDGMSLRDYFAAAALQGLVASPAFRGEKFQGDIEGAASFAYACADEMLKARGKVAPWANTAKGS